MCDEEKKDCDGADELIAGPEISEGVRPFVRHMSDHTIVSGVMKTAKDGQPVNGSEMVHLTQIEGNRYGVESIYDASKPDRVGPSKVVSKKYRDGWDRIFGDKTVGQA